MKLMIEQTNNGFILQGKFDDTSGMLSKQVIEDKDDELESMKELLYTVKEYFGCYNSKHNQKNLTIEIKDNK